jgi:hypothetical protein
VIPTVVKDKPGQWDWKSSLGMNRSSNGREQAISAAKERALRPAMVHRVLRNVQATDSASARISYNLRDKHSFSDRPYRARMVCFHLSFLSVLWNLSSTTVLF